ncbi:MAG: hypothetical protein IPG88_25620 [Gemmatimonadetes bacterium]|nr:hypothetical protein [Gemmatimonadota bacterium]
MQALEAKSQERRVTVRRQGVERRTPAVCDRAGLIRAPDRQQRVGEIEAERGEQVTRLTNRKRVGVAQRDRIPMEAIGRALLVAREVVGGDARLEVVGPGGPRLFKEGARLVRLSLELHAGGAESDDRVGGIERQHARLPTHALQPDEFVVVGAGEIERSLAEADESSGLRSATRSTTRPAPSKTS